MKGAAASATVHATCLVVGEAGILIRGEAGTGKTTLARALLEAVSARGGFARLVADDRVRLERVGDAVLARPVPAIGGLVEVRGLGIVAVAHEPSTRLALVVDIAADGPDRMPEPDEASADILGVILPRLVFAPRATQAGTVLEALRGVMPHA